MKKILFEKKFEDKVKITDVILGENDVVIKSDKADIVLTYEHRQDCCEHVAADFSPMKYATEDLKIKTVTKMIIKSVQDEGFLLCFETYYYQDQVKVFIPCHNYQNGYYSDELLLKIKIGDTETTIDLQKENVVDNNND